MKIPKPRMSPELIEKVRLLYAEGRLSNKEIAEKYGKPANWVNYLATQYSWPLRTKPGKPVTEAGSKVRRPGSRKPLSEAEYRAQKAAREAEIARELYGDLLPDVEYLRRKMPVYRDGDLIMVGGIPRTESQVREIAARERRLEKPVQTFVTAPIADEPDAPAIPLGQCGCGKGANHPGRCWFRRGMPGPSQGTGVYARVRALEAELAALRERLNAIDKPGCANGLR